MSMVNTSGICGRCSERAIPISAFATLNRSAKPTLGTELNRLCTACLNRSDVCTGPRVARLVAPPPPRGCLVLEGIGADVVTVKNGCAEDVSLGDYRIYQEDCYTKERDYAVIAPGVIVTAGESISLGKSEFSEGNFAEWKSTQSTFLQDSCGELISTLHPCSPPTTTSICEKYGSCRNGKPHCPPYKPPPIKVEMPRVSRFTTCAQFASQQPCPEKDENTQIPMQPPFEQFFPATTKTTCARTSQVIPDTTCSVPIPGFALKVAQDRPTGVADVPNTEAPSTSTANECAKWSEYFARKNRQTSCNVADGDTSKEPADMSAVEADAVVPANWKRANHPHWKCRIPNVADVQPERILTTHYRTTPPLRLSGRVDNPKTAEGQIQRQLNEFCKSVSASSEYCTPTNMERLTADLSSCRACSS